MNAATGTGFVTVTDPDGNTTVYDYHQGTLAAQSAVDWRAARHAHLSRPATSPMPPSPATAAVIRAPLPTPAATTAPCWTRPPPDGNGNTTTLQLRQAH